MASGVVVGALLAFSTLVVTRRGRPWFTISLGIVVGVMMISYVAVPARLIGSKPPKQSKRDKLAAAAAGGALSATVCTPPYILGRLGIMALGSSAVIIFILGLFAVSLEVTLQAGATGAVRAIKMSATLTAARHRSDAQRAAPDRDAAQARLTRTLIGLAGDADRRNWCNPTTRRRSEKVWLDVPTEARPR
jgi:hypothetical protein